MIAYLWDRCIVLGMKSAGIIALVLLCLTCGPEAQNASPAPSPIATKPQARPASTEDGKGTNNTVRDASGGLPTWSLPSRMLGRA